MGWRFDAPLVSLTDDAQNKAAKELWARESLGGIKEDNNRLPRPVIWLLALTILTAFLITAPLWGQRPQAAIYQEYVALMDDPQVQSIADPNGKVEYIVNAVKSKGSKYEALQERHPVEWDDLMLIKDQVIELERKGVDLEEYTIIGPWVTLANFEGEKKPDGSTIRKQPHWDKGYTIDVFYVIYFCVAVVIAVKRLPEFSWVPTHAGH